MRRSTRRLALLAVAGLGVLAWPGPAGADTSLGGYSGSAVAEPVRIEIFEPVIPIPASPEIDAGIAYTQVNTDTGPVSRALASYLWPGPVIGDGFGTLVGNDAAKYPVQVNSRNPPTKDSPAENTAQLTDGNGMTTQSDDTTTRATASGLGITGPDTDLLGGIGTGLNQLGGKSPPSSTAKKTELPVPVSKALAGVATVGNVTSVSDVTVGESDITSTAHAFVSEIKLLGGVVTIGAVDITATTVSDGTKATNTATINVGDVKVGGQALGIDQKGLELAGTTVKLPKLPVDDVLAKLGIAFSLAQTQKQIDGATGSFSAQGLTISVDTKPLKKLLGLSAITDPLAAALEKIPNLGSTLGPALGLGPQIEIQLGNVSTSAMAAPAYDAGSFPPSSGGSGSTAPAATGSVGTGGALSGGGGALSDGGGGLSGGGGNVPSSSGGGVGSAAGLQPVASTGLDLPPLGAVPKILILAGLILAGAFGWLLRRVGATLFGGAAGCDYGFESGVPDLRKA